MADWSFPKLSSFYVDVINMLKARDDDSAKMFSGTGSSLKEGFVTWNAGASKFEVVLADGTSKQDLTVTYDINVSRLGGNDALYFLPSEAFNPQAILDNIKTVDGAGSGLNCDFFRDLAPSAFATSVQGGKADTALQDAGAFATAEQGIKADNALPASTYTPSDFVRADGVQALSIDALRQSGDSVSVHKGDGSSQSVSVVATNSARALHADALRVLGTNVQLVKANGASEVVAIADAIRNLGDYAASTPALFWASTTAGAIVTGTGLSTAIWGGVSPAGTWRRRGAVIKTDTDYSVNLCLYTRI